MKQNIFRAAFRYSVPILLGYVAIGVAFGLMLSGAGYPWWFAPLMSLWMYAGAGQYIAVGLFAAGTSLLEACLVQLVVNARHIAYGFSMFNRFKNTGVFKPYLIFSLTDETFALLSSLPEKNAPFGTDKEKRRRFMFYVAALDQLYWVAGSLAGAVAGSLIPFDMKGIEFALTSLFVVLMIEQWKRLQKSGVFIVSAAAALLTVFFLPNTIAFLSAIIIALVCAPFTNRKHPEQKS
jgi:4-azaleucine resistance transporter AzlC